MATTISIRVAGVTAARSFSDDVKSTNALLNFYEAKGLGAEDNGNVSNQTKLERIVDWFVREIVRSARLRYVELARDAAQQQAEQENGFE